MIQLVIFFLLLFYAAPVVALTPEEDFTARCAAAGVKLCVGFDDDTDFATSGANRRLVPDGLGTYRAFKDTDIKVSGSGALRFDLPPPPHAGQNIAGHWAGAGTPYALWSPKFGQNSTMYFQYRMRISPEMLSNNWPTSSGTNAWKTMYVYMDGNPCLGGSGIATHNNGNAGGIISSYLACGQITIDTNPLTHSWQQISQLPPGVDYSFQQGDYESTCTYRTSLANRVCWHWVPNKWLTFYGILDIGTWNTPNTRFRQWVQVEGTDTMILLHDTPNIPWYCMHYYDCSGVGATDGLNNVALDPYMSRLDPNAGLPGVTSHIWFDELIISSQPIAQPMTAGTPPPPPPSPPVPRDVGGGGRIEGGSIQ